MEKENNIQTAILDYLSLKKYFFWRQNNFTIFDGKNFRKLPKYALKGIPDIIIIKDGKFIGLEIKTKIGTLSEGQKEFMIGCEKAGGQYYIVKSIDDVIKLNL